MGADQRDCASGGELRKRDMTTAHSPWRAFVAHAIFSTEPAALWKVIAPFDGLPALAPELIVSGTAKGEGVGMTRELHLRDGGVAKEELIAFHPETFRYVYAMTENGAMPWEHYFCSVQLQKLGGDQTHLSATGFFQPREGKDAEIRAMLTGVYGALINGYARALGVPVVMQS